MGRAVTSTLHRAHTSASIYIYTKSIDRLPAGATCRYSHRPRIATQRQIGKTAGSPIAVPDLGSERFQSRVCWNPGNFVTRTYINVSKSFVVDISLHILSHLSNYHVFNKLRVNLEIPITHYVSFGLEKLRKFSNELFSLWRV